MTDNAWEKAMHFGRLMGCHQRPDRSFFFHGRQFPLCARCTGIWLGALFSIPFVRNAKPSLLYFAGILPMAIDGIAQGVTNYESNNTNRVLSGFGYGLALSMLTAGYIKRRANL